MMIIISMTPQLWVQIILIYKFTLGIHPQIIKIFKCKKIDIVLFWNSMAERQEFELKSLSSFHLNHR